MISGNQFWYTSETFLKKYVEDLRDFLWMPRKEKDLEVTILPTSFQLLIYKQI